MNRLLYAWYMLKLRYLLNFVEPYMRVKDTKKLNHQIYRLHLKLNGLETERNALRGKG